MLLLFTSLWNICRKHFNGNFLVGTYEGDLEELAGDLEELALLYIKRKEDKSYVCSICGKASRHLHHAKAHLEGSHFPSATGYECQICGSVLKTKNTLACHMSQKHRNKQYWTLQLLSSVTIAFKTKKSLSYVLETQIDLCYVKLHCKLNTNFPCQAYMELEALKILLLHTS